MLFSHKNSFFDKYKNIGGNFMKTIYIIDILNSMSAYQLVRHFKFQTSEYLIYTNSHREKHNNIYYINNHVAIKRSDDMWVQPTQQEWEQFQKIIKQISEESSLGIVTSIQDLHVEDRDSFIVISNRSFKVIPFYHHLISSNFNDYQLQTSSNTSKISYQKEYNPLQYQYEISTIDAPNINYVKEYYELKKLTIEQKNKLNQIKQIINET